MTDHVAKVGVVVPVWNVAPYIERCAESLMAQTLDDMQFVFVDDASPDNSIEILNAVLARHPERAAQVSVVHHEVNKGLPTARKTGLAHINAEYVAHCDSDDWCDPTMYEKMYFSAKSNGADMVLCDYYRTDGKKTSTSHIKKPGNDNMALAFVHQKLPPYVWCRLTRTEIYRCIDFPVENYLEDWVQNIQLHYYCKEADFIAVPLYYHFCNPTSIVHTNTYESCEEKTRQCMENMRLFSSFALMNHICTEKDLILRKSLVRGRLKPKLLRFRCRKQYLNMFPEINHSILSCKEISRVEKLYFLAVYLNIFPFVYYAYTLRCRWRGVIRFLKNRVASRFSAGYLPFRPVAMLKSAASPAGPAR